MNTFFKLAAFLLAAVLLFVSWAPALAAGEKLHWKAATLAPKRVGWSNQVADVLIPAITKASEGNLEIKIYWGGIMGDDENVILKMKKGILQVAGFAGQGAVLACPETAVLSLPFMFNDYKEVDYIREKMHATFEKLSRQRGFVLFLWIDQDFDQIYTSEKPIATLADFQGVPFLTWYGILEEQLLVKLGARPVPVNVPEVSRSMRSGKTEALIGPALWMVGSQMYSVVKYLNTAKIRYSPALIMNTVSSWDATPAAYTKRLWDQRMDLARRFYIKTREDNRAALKAMLEYGVKEVKFSPDQMKALRKTTAPVWQELAGTLYPEKVLGDLIHYLEEYRKTASP